VREIVPITYSDLNALTEMITLPNVFSVCVHVLLLVGNNVLKTMFVLQFHVSGNVLVFVRIALLIIKKSGVFAKKTTSRVMRSAKRSVVLVKRGKWFVI